jgi:glycosyltransferase involved in cell wall biosynthesis
MKALVVAPQPFFTPRGTPLSVYYRSMVAAELGTEIDLLTYGQGRDVDIPELRIFRIPAFRFLGPVPVGPSLLKAWLDLFMIVRTIVMLLRNRYDFVHAHEEAVFFLRFLKPLFGFKLVYDMHSSLPQQLANFNFSSSRLLRRVFEKLEDSCLARSDAVITISPALESYALERMPDPRRHFLIENSIFEDVRLRNAGRAGGEASGGEGERDPLAGIPGHDALIVYAGTFERYQGIDLLLRAFARVLERRPGAFLVLAGGAPAQVQTYRAMAEELGVAGRCRFTGSLPPPVAKSLMLRATLLVSARTEGTNTPMKIYHYLAIGIPFVATDIVSHTQVVDARTCFLVRPEPGSFAEGILAALEDPERAREVVRQARTVYDQRYSKRAYARKMLEMFRLLDPELRRSDPVKDEGAPPCAG